MVARRSETTRDKDFTVSKVEFYCSLNSGRKNSGHASPEKIRVCTAQRNFRAGRQGLYSVASTPRCTALSEFRPCIERHIFMIRAFFTWLVLALDRRFDVRPKGEFVR